MFMIDIYHMYLSTYDIPTTYQMFMIDIYDRHINHMYDRHHHMYDRYVSIIPTMMPITHIMIDTYDRHIKCMMYLHE